MSDGEPLLVVDAVTKAFGTGAGRVLAVNGASLRTDRGEISLIMGPSGSGKTTLLTLIGALLRADSGSIRIDGREITSLAARELPALRRRSIGFVFQTFNLLDALTARENVEIAINVAGVRGAAAAARARELLVDAGLETRIDFRARDLSGGEKQRVSIARALANRPLLLLADEPTANLDSKNGADVMALLRDLTLRERCAAIVVSHDTRLAHIADRVLWMQDGRVDSADPAGVQPALAPGER